MFVCRMPSIVSGLLSQAFSFFMKKVWHVGFWQDHNDDRQTNAGEDAQNPEDPLLEMQKVSSGVTSNVHFYEDTNPPI